MFENLPGVNDGATIFIARQMLIWGLFHAAYAIRQYNTESSVKPFVIGSAFVGVPKNITPATG